MTEPLVLLHGFTGSPESWSEVLTLLVPPPRALRLALLGHGEGPEALAAEAADDGRFETEVARLAGEIRRAGFTGAHLVGYSLGARVGIGLLARQPDLFARATLAGVHPGLATGAERAERRAADQRWIDLLERGGVEAFLDAWEAQPLFATQQGLPADQRRAQRRQRQGHRAAGLARALRTLGLANMPDYRPDLAAIRVPVTLITGARDEKFCRLAAEATQRLPRAELRSVPAVGHNVVLEAPAAVAAALRGDLPGSQSRQP